MEIAQVTPTLIIFIMKNFSNTDQRDVLLICFHAWTHNRTRNKNVIKEMANEIEKRNEGFLIYQDENGVARVKTHKGTAPL